MGNALDPVADGACQEYNDGQGGAEPRPAAADHYSTVEPLDELVLATVYDEGRQYRCSIRTLSTSHPHVGVKGKGRAARQ